MDEPSRHPSEPRRDDPRDPAEARGPRWDAARGEAERESGGDDPPEDAVDEVALARGLRDRAPDAIEVFVERYGPLLHHCIGQFERDPGLREDLFQELLTHTLERLDLDRFDPERGSLGSWLYRVAWCRCVDVKRRESSGRRVGLVPTTETTPEPASADPGPARSVGGTEVGALVRRTLAELDPDDAELLRLRHMHELTLPQIVERTGHSHEAIKYRLKRASDALRHRLLARRLDPELVE